MTIASVLCSIGVGYDAQSMYDNALEMFHNCLSIEDNLLGRMHLDTAATYKQYPHVMFMCRHPIVHAHMHHAVAPSKDTCTGMCLVK